MPTEVLDLIEDVKNEAKKAGYVYLKTWKSLIVQLQGFRAWKAGTHLPACKHSYTPQWEVKEKKKTEDNVTGKKNLYIQCIEYRTE